MKFNAVIKKKLAIEILKKNSLENLEGRIYFNTLNLDKY